MEISRLSSDVKYIGQIGVTFNLEERMKLELSLLKINENNNFEQILLWGKIEGSLISKIGQEQGVEKDYYIAIGIKFKGFYEFPSVKFFWSLNDFQFKELPEILPEHQELAESTTIPLLGKPEDTIKEPTEAQMKAYEDKLADIQRRKDEGDWDEDDDDTVEPPKSFTELDRLAYIVRTIHFDCAILPVGALKLCPTHELRYNDAFQGLTTQQASDISSYQHFRAPFLADTKTQIEYGDTIFKTKFLDPLDADTPLGVWSLHKDSSKTIITVRNLQWPGFVAYHRANTNIYGFCYFGNGLKNSELPFLV